MTAVGQWVRVRDDVDTVGGMHGSVAKTVGGGVGAMVSFDGPERFYLILRDDELVAPTITREAHARQRAALRLAHAEAAVVEARNALRAAVKAEIAAMPPLPDVHGFDEVRAAWETIVGPMEEEFTFHDDGESVRDTRWNGDGVGIRIRAPKAGGAVRLIFYVWESDDEWVIRLDDTTLDAAVKDALCWLADRDVFLLARAP